MAVEAATKISDLNVSLPDPADPLAEGDDHIRLLKSVLKTQLVNLPDVLDWSLQVVDRFVAIEDRLDAIEAALASDYVPYTVPGGDSIAIAGTVQAVNLVAVNSFDSQGASTVVDITAQNITCQNVNASGDVNADNVNAAGLLTSDGNVIAYQGS